MFIHLDKISFSKKKDFILKGLALLLVNVSIFILWESWTPFMNKHEFIFLSDSIFLLSFTLPSSFLAVYFFISAKILWQGVSSRGIHKLSVCISSLLAALLLIFVSEFIPKDHVFGTTVSISFIMVTAGIFFLLIERWLLKSFCCPKVINYATQRTATRIYFAFLAFLIWLDISATTEFLAKHATHEYLPANLWLAGLIVIGSIPVAYWCYRIGLNFFLKRPPKVVEIYEERQTIEPLDAHQVLNGTFKKSI